MCSAEVAVDGARMRRTTTSKYACLPLPKISRLSGCVQWPLLLLEMGAFAGLVGAGVDSKWTESRWKLVLFAAIGVLYSMLNFVLFQHFPSSLFELGHLKQHLRWRSLERNFSVGPLGVDQPCYWRHRGFVSARAIHRAWAGAVRIQRILFLRPIVHGHLQIVAGARVIVQLEALFGVIVPQ